MHSSLLNQTPDDDRNGSQDSSISSLDLRYVYYRVYNEHGAIRSLHPLNPDDPSLSRIYARFVAPPHTAASLKRYLCRVESVTGPTALFITTPSSSPMDDGDRIPFLTESSPGLVSQNPVAFVVQAPNMERNILETANTIDSSTEGTLSSETHYVYYRMYTEDGAIRSIQPFNADDPSLSRIYARSVAPPHTVASLKCRLCEVEKITGDTNLYVTLSSPTAIDDGEQILLQTDAGIGLTAQEPMVLVVKCSDPERTALLTADTADSLTTDTQFPETRYVYYRVYAVGGEIPSKHPVDPNDPSLGRIKVDSIPHPRTVASMRTTISRVENYFHLKVFPWHPKLFVNVFSESPMGETHDPNLAGEFPFSLDQPLAFTLPQILSIKAKYTDRYSIDKSLLMLVEGETYYTNGILLKRLIAREERDVYQAVSTAGAVGFVFPGSVEILEN